MTIEEDGLRWLQACFGRGVDAFTAADMLRAYEAGRAHPGSADCAYHACRAKANWFPVNMPYGYCAAHSPVNQRVELEAER